MNVMNIDGTDFWDRCALVSRDPEVVSGTAVLKGTRLPADTLVENVEAFEELQGMSQDEAIAATLEAFPSTPGGQETIRTLLAYQAAHMPQLQP